MAKSKKVKVELRLDNDLIAFVDYAVTTGILGGDRSKVIRHMLRQRLWDEHVATLERKISLPTQQG